jgi:hypothetical protein
MVRRVANSGGGLCFPRNAPLAPVVTDAMRAGASSHKRPAAPAAEAPWLRQQGCGSFLVTVIGRLDRRTVSKAALDKHVALDELDGSTVAHCAGMARVLPQATMTLNADERRALAMLASAGHKGTTQTLLSANGFGGAMIAGLVDHGFATLTLERVKAASPWSPEPIEVGRVRITEAGRKALTVER